MRILTISNLYPPNAIGGYETLCFDVMNALSHKGHHVEVLPSTFGTLRANYSLQTVQRKLGLLATEGNIYAPFVASEEHRNSLNRKNIEIFQQVVISSKPDILFVWNLYFFDASLLAALEKSPVPKVYLLTDNWFIAMQNPQFIADYFAREVNAPSTGFLRKIRALRSCLILGGKKNQPVSGSAIFASIFMRRLYQQAGIHFEHNQIIYHGINQPAQERPDRDFSQPLKTGYLKLLFAGRLVEIKGVHTAIEALPKIMCALPEMKIHLTLVGDERDLPYIQKMRKLIASLGLEQNISFLPQVAENQLAELFNQHDMYLFPSLYEPFSLTLIHALIAGIPTLASTAGGTPEIVRHNKTGFLFEAGDSADLARQAIRLATSPGLRRELSSNAREVARNYSFKHMVDQVEGHLVAAVEGTS